MDHDAINQRCARDLLAWLDRLSTGGRRVRATENRSGNQSAAPEAPARSVAARRSPAGRARRQPNGQPNGKGSG